jgi:putative exosortase-associated protein (TIGR04073 family)
MESVTPCLLFLIAASFAVAADQNSAGNPMEGHMTLMSRKLIRGVTNAVTGIGEVPRQITRATIDEKSAATYTRGTVSGFGMAIMRTAVGVIERATFIIQAPGNYDPLLAPHSSGKTAISPLPGSKTAGRRFRHEGMQFTKPAPASPYVAFAATTASVALRAQDTFREFT